jgi:hypothetical protein
MVGPLLRFFSLLSSPTTGGRYLARVYQPYSVFSEITAARRAESRMTPGRSPSRHFLPEGGQLPLQIATAGRHVELEIALHRDRPYILDHSSA